MRNNNHFNVINTRKYLYCQHECVITIISRQQRRFSVIQFSDSFSVYYDLLKSLKLMGIGLN